MGVARLGRRLCVQSYVARAALEIAVKYAEIEIGMRVLDTETKRIGTVIELHPVLTIANPPPGTSRMVFNMVSYAFDTEHRFTTPQGICNGATVPPEILEHVKQ